VKLLPPFVAATLLLCAALLAPALFAGLLAATVQLSIKRSALIVMAGTAWVLAQGRPHSLWARPSLRAWRAALGERRARLGLILVAALALALATLFPLSWLRVLP
jgi:hypothetical protein